MNQVKTEKNLLIFLGGILLMLSISKKGN